MSDEQVQRRLAAIFYADVAGYSRLTGEDELGTHRRLSAYLDLLTSSIENQAGRVVHFAGDAILAEFGSVVDAVTAAVKAQRELAQRDAELPADQKLQFRIGINLGEIIVDRDDIFGDGVNVAARLEALADPGGVCISGMVHRQVTGKLDVGFEDMGAHEVKNIADPVHAFRVLLDPADAGALRAAPPPKSRSNWAPIAAGAGALLVTATAVGIWQFATTPGVSDTPPAPAAVSGDRTKSAKPAIAILPFTNLSAEADGYLADGIAEDIITALSQVPGLSVISRNSTFTYKGKNVTPREVSKKLGVRYVLEGSFRKAGKRVRVSARLIDTSTNLTLWAEQLDREFTDIFMLQDEISRAIVGNLSRRLTSAEQFRGSTSRPHNVEAYELVLQARRLSFRSGRTGRSQATKLLEKAIKLDPGYAQAYAALAWVQSADARLGRPADRAKYLEAALRNAEKAYELADDDYFSYWTLGIVHSHLQNTDKAVANFQKALELNPNAADIYTSMVRVHLRKGNVRAAVEAAQTAIRLNPVHPPRYKVALGTALFAAGRLEEATAQLELANKQNVANPSARLFLAALYAKQNRPDDVKRIVTSVKDKFPRINIRRAMRGLRFIPADERPFYRRAFREAGLPIGPRGKKGKRKG